MRYDVCVLGGASLDLTYYLDEKNNVKNIEPVKSLGGKGANQAVAASRAGAKVTIITKIGDDENGKYILESLIKNGVDVSKVETMQGQMSDYSNVYIAPISKDNKVERHGNIIDTYSVDIIEKNKEVILNSKVVVFQSKVPKEVTAELVNFCYANNIPLVFTPCLPERFKLDDLNNLELINKITYITANEKECAQLFGTDNIFECVKRYPNKLIVSLGDKGVVFSDGVDIIQLPPDNVKNIEDTTGAGDTLNGNFVAAILTGMSVKNAITRAQNASCMKIQEKATQAGMPYKEELDSYILNKISEGFRYNEELMLAIELVKNAAFALQRKLNTSISVKADKTFVTDSDLFVEELITKGIKAKFIKDNFVTEEFNSKNKISDRTWIIDPIDGTAHYMKKSIYWSIQLAFIDNEETQFSIIYVPKLDELYFGLKDRGVYLNYQKIELSKPKSISESTAEFCGSLCKCRDERKEVFNKLLNNPQGIANFMHINSCSFAFANLLSGRTDTLILSAKKPWDVIPGTFMLKEVGVNRFSYGALEIFSNVQDIEEIIT